MEPFIDNKTINDFFDNLAEEISNLKEWIEESIRGLEIQIDRAWDNLPWGEDAAADFEQEAKERIDELEHVLWQLETVEFEAEFKGMKTKDM